MATDTNTKKKDTFERENEILLMKEESTNARGDINRIVDVRSYTLKITNGETGEIKEYDRVQISESKSQWVDQLKQYTLIPRRLELTPEEFKKMLSIGVKVEK